MENKPHIFFVDDELKVCEVVGRILERLGLKVSCFARAADCLVQLRSEVCGLPTTEVKVPTVDGLELLIEAKRINPPLLVLVVSGYGDIAMAVKALKTGVLDFVEKPLDREIFLSNAERALTRSRPTNAPVGKGLTKTETTVLRRILNGKSNKEIAHLLHRSVRTIEVHRGHIMRKLGVDNIVQLVKRSAAMGLVELSVNR